MLSAFVQDGSPGGGAVMEPEAGGSGRSCEWKLEQDLFSHGQTFFFLSTQALTPESSLSSRDLDVLGWSIWIMEAKFIDFQSVLSTP